jgi:ADP-heptose:LPS heptosyltransferase/GT2 family glycosyltransferase
MQSSGFRPGEDLAAHERPAIEPPPAPPALGFTAAADAGGTDLDVLMGYQILLGRDPENSFVIADAKSSPVGAFIRALVSSGEFQSSVLDRLDSGRPLPHEAAAIAPTRHQLDWLFRIITTPSYAETMLRSAPTWRDFLRVFLAIPGVPLPPARAAAAKPAEPSIAATAADEGFVLINLEQPKPGEKLQPGALVSGSGWTIAPAEIAEIAILLDDHLLTHARYGLPRPDVARVFPHYRHVDHCGFAFTAEIPAAAAITPASQLIVRVRTTTGEEGMKGLRVHPPAPSGAPEAAAADAWPIRLAVDEALVDDGRVLRLRGWAATRASLQAVTAQLGETPLDGVRTGLARPDIAKAHPDYPNAATSGFALIHDLADDVPAGPAFVRLQATDSAGHSRQTILPVTIPLSIRASAGAAPAPEIAVPRAAEIRLQLDTPELEGDQAREILRGALTISGWVVARTGVDGVDILCDGKLLGRAHLGMRREDIGAAFSDFPDSLFAGYALVLPPGALPPGRHAIIVRATAKQQGHGQPATTEIRFLLEIAPADAVLQGAELRTRLPAAETTLGVSLLARAGIHPHFHCLITAGPASLSALAATLKSLSAQAYEHWTATLVVPAKDLPKARALPEANDTQGRIAFVAAKPKRSTEKPKTPDYILKLRAGDRLGADALLEFALEAAARPDAGLIYADDLRPDRGQSREHAFFKPDWSPNLLLATNYIGRAWCARTETAEAAGLGPENLAAASDYEAILRLAEQAKTIAHVPRALAACTDFADTQAEERAALIAALDRRATKATAEPGPVPGTWRIRRALVAAKGVPKAGTPLVSIIIPTCSAKNLVRTAIASIRATTAPARKGGIEVEIIAVDNTPAKDKSARAWLRKNADTVIAMDGTFNWSRFNNAGAAAARGTYLLFLNDDIEITQPDWLESLLEHAQRPDIGVVGAKLLYPDGKIQHAGQYLADGHARHAFRFAEGASPGPFGLAAVAREMIAVTGACQMMHRRVYEKLGGYEEAHSIVNNDLDFCLRCWQAGLTVIYTPHVEMLHHELASRARLDDSFDETRFKTAWRTRFLLGDPFRNPSLAKDSDHYGAEPEPTTRLYAGHRLKPASDIRKILAVKLDHIGDFLTALPALHALHAQFPHAAIDLLVPSASASLAAPGGTPDASLPVQNVLIFDFFHARSGEGQRSVGAAEFAALHARLAPQAYDLAIDLRMHPETRPVLQHTGAATLAGYDHANAYPWLDIALEWEGDIRLVRKRAHVSERLVQLVSAVADACGGVATPLAPTRPGSSAVPAVLKTLPAGFLARPLVCIHPGVGNVVRQWPAASYASLIGLLAEQEGLHAVLIGAAEEAPIAEAIMRAVADPAVVESLVGRVKLAELPEVMRACVLFVGNNSGPQHIAASLGLPTIGIHSGVVDAAEWAPLGPQAMALRRNMICSPCYLEFASDCPRDLACLTGLSPRDVFAACRRLLPQARATG